MQSNNTISATVKTNTTVNQDNSGGGGSSYNPSVRRKRRKVKRMSLRSKPWKRSSTSRKKGSKSNQFTSNKKSLKHMKARYEKKLRELDRLINYRDKYIKQLVKLSIDLGSDLRAKDKMEINKLRRRKVKAKDIRRITKMMRLDGAFQNQNSHSMIQKFKMLLNYIREISQEIENVNREVVGIVREIEIDAIRTTLGGTAKVRIGRKST